MAAPDDAARVVDALRHELAAVASSRPPATFMEVCGTHTMAIARFGLRELLPASVRLVSGPGCPVCVTAHRDLDHIVALARLPEVTLVTFGDLIRVPASRSSLAAERAAGADVRVVYSPRDAVELAAAAPERQVVFAGIGFETTAPTTAAALLEARAEGLTNFSLLSLHKTMPLPLRALLDLGETPIGGFLLPGHVSVITGTACYGFLAREYGIAGVVAGFEARDVLAFGDSYNDADMLAWAGTGVAMGGAPPEVIAVADFTCEPVEQDGFALHLLRQPWFPVGAMHVPPALYE